MAENKKVSLAQGTEVDIRGMVVKVYSPTFDKFVELQDKMVKFDKIEKVSDQIKAAVDVLYDVLQPYNEGLTKEKITASFTMDAFVKVIELAFGTQKSKDK